MQTPQVPSKSDIRQVLASHFSELQLLPFLLALGTGIALSLVLVAHHRRFAGIASNRAELRSAIPFVLLTTVLIISVVKSEIALSLGLVGALSIVRFRTPLKEPEELAYMFLALAIGIGLGADQILITVIAAAVILLFLAIGKSLAVAPDSKQLYLSIELAGAPTGGTLGRLHDLIGRHARGCDLRRYDARNDGVEATYVVDLGGTADLAKLSEELRAAFPSINLTFLDQSRLPAV